MNEEYTSSDSIAKTPINWHVAVGNLGPEAFYMLAILYYKITEASDKSIMAQTGFGLSKHRKYKRELMDACYLTIDQIGRAKYLYTIGQP